MHTLQSLLVGIALIAASTDAPQRQTVYQVRAKEILLGDGTRLDEGVLLVERGKIARVGRGVEIDPRLPLVEHDGVLAPGFVACQTESGERGEGHDPTRSLFPEARVVHAFRPDHSDFEASLRCGITTVVLTPTGDNLVGGLTAVVKTAGEVVLEREAHLALSFGSSPLSQVSARSPFPDFGAASADDDLVQSGGPENTDAGRRGSRQPTSYPGALRELRERFAHPQGAFARAARGELPVLLEAWDRHEVMRAVEFAREQRLRGAIRGAPRAGDAELVEVLARSGLGVVVGPYGVGQRRHSLESIKALQAEGVLVGFALGAPRHSPEGLRLSAALALAAGAERAALLRALTSDAAKIAGVEERVGSLARGKDADFVLWSGDPLDLSSHVDSVWVDGNRVWTRETKAPSVPAAAGESRTR